MSCETLSMEHFHNPEECQGDDDNDGFTVTVNSENIIAEHNKVLASMDGSLPPIAKKAGTVSTYQMKAFLYIKVSVSGRTGKMTCLIHYRLQACS